MVLKKKFSLIEKAERALKQAVYQTIKEHAKTNDDIVIYKNGKVVKLPAKGLRLKKPT